jgi:hypothetical protein
MDALQDRVVKLGLVVLSDFSFALAGGYALQAHQLVSRMSEDVDLFTDSCDPSRFAQAVDAVSEAFRCEGLRVDLARRAETFARIEVTDPTSGQRGAVVLAADYRNHQPVMLSVGPVPAEPDAVATKVAAVFSRGLARDYIDLAAILDNGRYSREQLMDLAAGVDAGFSKGWFAEALAAIDRFEDADFTRYGIDVDRVARIRGVMRDWSQQLNDAIVAPEATPDTLERQPQQNLREKPQARPVPRRPPFPAHESEPDRGSRSASHEGPAIDP